MRMAVYGNDQLKFRDQDKETDTRIQLDVSDRNKTDQLMKLTFINADNQLVYLSQFAKVVPQSGPSGLERRNKQPSITLLAQVSGRPVGDVGEDLKQEIAKLSLSKDVKVLYEGDLELQDDSFTNLGLALLVSFALIYLIMVTLYNNWLFPFCDPFFHTAGYFRCLTGVGPYRQVYERIFHFRFDHDDGPGG
jgi:multidrug efflux pump subunit AcrB